MMKKPSVNPELVAACARPENKVCADCGTKGTNWACVNLGVFICTDCSAIHRKIGVHISVVKSITLDTWKPEWVSMCAKVGNRIACNYYEHKLPLDFPRPGEPGGFTEGIENWIRNKYEHKQYAPSNRGQRCLAPCELVGRGEDADVYPKDGNQSKEEPASKTETPVEQQKWAHFEPSHSSLYATLSDYYARIGQCKSAAQINLIIDKYKDNVSTLFAQLEEKYGRRVQEWADFSSPECSLIQPTEVLLSDVFSGADVQAPNTVPQGQPAITCKQKEFEVLIEPKAVCADHTQQLDVLQNSLSALYQQPNPHASPSGANYAALMNMQPSLQQAAWAQHMVAMAPMGSNIAPLAATHQPFGVVQ